MGGRLNRVVPTVLVLLIGIMGSVAAFTAVHEYVSNRSQARFVSLAGDRASLIEEGLSRAIFAIQSVGSLYDTVDEVSAAQFAGFAEPLLKRFPTLTAVGWVPKVREEVRTAFERAAQSLLPGFRITERDDQGGLRGASGREVYFPVYHIRPYEGNEAALGFDIYSNPVRRVAIDRAGETGKTISTARIRLVQETGEQYSLLLIHPVFRRDVASVGIKRLRGVASAVYRIGDGVEGALARVDPSGLDIWLFDRSGEPESQFLYFHTAQKDRDWVSAPDPPVDGSSVYAHRFDLGGREFELLLAPGSGYLDYGRAYLAWLALIVGLSFTALLAAYLALVLQRARELVEGHQALEHQIGERRGVEKKLRQANKQLEILTRKDSLTGVANRRYFDEYFEKEWRLAVRNGTPLALLLGDVDFFKAYNDAFGHLAGDQCLRKIARAMADVLERPGDLTARYGGEEFALILPNTDVAGAYEVAEKARLAVAALELPQQNPAAAGVVTISFGCGSIVPTQDDFMVDFVRSVDSALYQAKQQGRNRTVLFR